MASRCLNLVMHRFGFFVYFMKAIEVDAGSPSWLPSLWVIMMHLFRFELELDYTTAYSLKSHKTTKKKFTSEREFWDFKIYSQLNSLCTKNTKTISVYIYTKRNIEENFPLGPISPSNLLLIFNLLVNTSLQGHRVQLSYMQWYFITSSEIQSYNALRFLSHFILLSLARDRYPIYHF